MSGTAGQKLSDLDSFDFEVLGMSVRVAIGDSEIRARISELLADFPSSTGPPTHVLRVVQSPIGGPIAFSLLEGDILVRDGMQRSETEAMLLWQLNQIALRTANTAVLHAGCVARHGRGVVMSAPMEAGKSTLVTALILSGFDYLSDEFAAIDLSDGHLHPHPAPVALDPGSFPLFPRLEPKTPTDPARWLLRAGDVRPGSLSGPVPPGLVILPDFQPDSQCRLQRIGRRETLAALVDQTLNLRTLGGIVFASLGRLVRSVPAYRLVFDDLEDACMTIDRTLGPA